MEDGESFAEAAARELREETGLTGPLHDVGPPQAYKVPEELREQYTPGTARVVVQSFSVEAPPGWEPVLNDEHLEHRWCPVDEAIALAHWPETRAIFEALARQSAV